MSVTKKPKILGDVQPVPGLDITSLKRSASTPPTATAEKLKEQLKPIAAGFVSTRTMMPTQQMVKDAFAMPAEDYAIIQATMDRALFHRRRLSKVGTVRAALRSLAALSDEALLALIDNLPELKPGPRK